MTLTTLKLSTQNRISTVTLHRPKVRNAINLKMLQELRLVFSELEKDDECHVVVLTGEGSVFCSGADLNEMLRATPKEQEGHADLSKDLSETLKQMSTFSKPLVAAVNGPAIGGGVGLLCTADITLCVEKALFRFSEVHLGLVPAVISPFVTERIGKSNARRYMLTGEPISSKNAKDSGLVNEVVSKESFEECLHSLLQHILKGAGDALKECKSLIDYVTSHDMDSSLVYAEKALNRVRETPEAKRRINKFLSS